MKKVDILLMLLIITSPIWIILYLLHRYKAMKEVMEDGTKRTCG